MARIDPNTWSTIGVGLTRYTGITTKTIKLWVSDGHVRTQTLADGTVVASLPDIRRHARRVIADRKETKRSGAPIKPCAKFLAGVR